MAQAQSIFIPFVGSNANLSGASLVLRQDAPAGPLPPNVFRDWASLYAAYQQTDGPAQIEFDNTFATCRIEPAAAYTFRPETFLLGGNRVTGGGDPQNVLIADGVTFDFDTLDLRDFVALVSESSAPIVTAPAGLGKLKVIIIERGSALRADGSAAFVESTGSPAVPEGVLFFLDRGGRFQTGVSPVLDLPDVSPASAFALIVVGDGEVEADTIDGAGIAIVSLLVNQAAGLFSFTQPGFSSVAGPLNQIAVTTEMPNILWENIGISGGAGETAQPDQFFLIGAGGASIDLPPSTDVFSGCRVRIHNTGGAANPTTVTPSGADTINGAAGAFVTPGDANEDFEFVLDAPTANWLMRPVSTSPGAVLGFGNNNVAATTVTRYLAPWYSDTQAETSPTQIRSPRSGTLRNLRVRHNVTAGDGDDIVYTVRVNGAGTALVVTLASTASDGSDLANTVPVSAGDLLDIEVTKADGIGSSPTNITATLELA